MEFCGGVFQGSWDALRYLHLTYSLLRGSTTIRDFMKHTVLLNAVVLLGTYSLFEYILLPHFVGLLGPSPGTYGKIVRYYLICLFYGAWLIPVYSVSYAFNAQWTNRIAARTYYHVYQRNGESAAVGDIFIGFMRPIYRSVIISFFIILSFLIYFFLPFVGSYLYFVCLCWIYSLSIFEYTWANRQIRFIKNLEFFEQRWTYFLGFGIPVTALSFFLDIIPSYCVLSIALPLFIPVAVWIDDSSIKKLEVLPTLRVHQYLDNHMRDVISLFTSEDPQLLQKSYVILSSLQSYKDKITDKIMKKKTT